MYKTIIKPIFDKILAILLIPLVLPFIITVSILLFLLNKREVFYIQKRPGENGRIFKIYKFKTMTDEKDEKGNLLPDEKRLTKTGAYIRRLSMDELLQIFNVLKGDLSFVGPRPLLTEYVPLYNEFQKRRHEVKPGITGWAQVNGRNAISWQQKFEYDVWYVDNISFWLDLKILFLTIKKVFKTEGISSSTSATMEKFTGN
jgi:lipopolysaccharide/colanic/teichoic acid biosynthesis glycosyltransferase